MYNGSALQTGLKGTLRSDNERLNNFGTNYNASVCTKWSIEQAV